MLLMCTHFYQIGALQEVLNVLWGRRILHTAYIACHNELLKLKRRTLLVVHPDKHTEQPELAAAITKFLTDLLKV